MGTVLPVDNGVDGSSKFSSLIVFRRYMAQDRERAGCNMEAEKACTLQLIVAFIQVGDNSSEKIQICVRVIIFFVDVLRVFVDRAQR